MKSVDKSTMYNVLRWETGGEKVQENSEGCHINLCDSYALMFQNYKYRYTLNQSLWADVGDFWISSHCLRPALPSNPHNFLKTPDEEQRQGQEDEADRGI